jgi:hypothetical protein
MAALVDIDNDGKTDLVTNLIQAGPPYLNTVCPPHSLGILSKSRKEVAYQLEEDLCADFHRPFKYNGRTYIEIPVSFNYTHSKIVQYNGKVESTICEYHIQKKVRIK